MSARDAELARLEAQVEQIKARRQRPPRPKLWVPDIDEFIHSDQFLHSRHQQEPPVYPRQLTFLKLVCLQIELLTPYDYDVIGEWQTRFERGDENGIQPDIFERIDLCRQQDMKWFREVMPILGRRGSKNYLGAIAGAYVLWNHLATGNPQEALGIDPEETLRIMVIASKHDQARDNQWRALRNRINEAPCFVPYRAKTGADAMWVFSPHDLERASEEPDFDWRRATFEITAEESTPSGLRGMASILIYFDEMAHGASPGTLAAVEELYEAATPSLDQTGRDVMIWETSTPSYQRGQFYTNYQHALARDERGPVDPRMLMVQLESWEFYRDWDRAPQLERVPGGHPFGAFDKAVITYEELRSEQRRNPHRFDVERKGHYAISEYAYLYAPKVRAIFEAFNGQELELAAPAMPGQIYVVHIDPSKVRANTGLAVAHAEIHNGEMHTIFDDLRAYVPQGPHHEVDYQLLKEDLRQILDRYQPDVMSFDVPEPIQTIQELRAYAAQRGYRTQIERRPTTRVGAGLSPRTSVNRSPSNASMHPSTRSRSTSY